MSAYRCHFCRKVVITNQSIGTAHRNHCPYCLWSKHVDSYKPGDRKSNCRTGMQPIGLTFKHEGWDKYGRPKRGELMVIHHCLGCGIISFNRIAADDEPATILEIFQNFKNLSSEIKKKLKTEKIYLLQEKDRPEVSTQLFGKSGAGLT